MVDWERQLYFEGVGVGTEAPPVTIPITLGRLVMEAGANRDFSSIHHNQDFARMAGAPGPFMNTFFIMGMFERTLREWIGLRGEIKKIGPFRMRIFNCVGDTVTFKAKVRDKHEEEGKGVVTLDIWSESHRGQTVTGEATVILPKGR